MVSAILLDRPALLAVLGVLFPIRASNGTRPHNAIAICSARGVPQRATCYNQY